MSILLVPIGENNSLVPRPSLEKGTVEASIQEAPLFVDAVKAIGMEMPSGRLCGHGDPLPSGSPNRSTIPVEDLEVPPGTLCGHGDPIPTNRPAHPGTTPVEDLEVPPGTLCVEAGANGASPLYASYKYRTINGHGYFEFEYKWSEKLKTHEIIILSSPSYGERSTNAVIIHIEPSSDNRRKICVKERVKLKRLSQAQSLSVQWAEMTQRYIEEGIDLDTQMEENYSPKSFLSKFKNSFLKTFDYAFSHN